jgi:Asp-tRNA(Asn)/Glu-tRNA(Gln) amidotransferase C subunit
MLEPNQVTQVINKIIEAGDLTSDTFVKLSQDLTDEQKDKFINEYVRGKITINDFKKMSNNLNKEQKKLSIKHNNTLLNDYELMTEVSEEFSEEELYQLSKVIDGKNISNSNSKVLLRKWSMSPEELRKHRENSFYVFLSTEEDYVEQLYKVDPLDPESYVTINMLKLKKQVRSDVKMFGIKISSSVLDEYVGKSSSSMSPDIIETIKKTANQI